MSNMIGVRVTKHVSQSDADVENCDYCGEPWPCADWHREQARIRKFEEEGFEEWWGREGKQRAPWIAGTTVEDTRKKLMFEGWLAARRPVLSDLSALG